MMITRRWLNRLPQMTLDEVTFYLIEKMNNRPFIHHNDSVVTFKEFGRSVGAWRGALQAHGMHHGTRVAIIAGNSPEWCAAYLAIATGGGVALLVDHAQRREQLLEMLRESGAEIVLTSTANRSLVEDLLDELSGIRCTVVMDGTTAGDERLMGAQEFLNKRTSLPNGMMKPDDPCTLVFVQTASGRAEAVTYSHREMLTRAVSMSRFIPAVSSEAVLNALPLHDIGPLISGFLAPFCFGSSVVMTQYGRSASQNPVKGYPTTLFISAPSLYDRMSALIRKRFTFRGGMHNKAG